MKKFFTAILLPFIICACGGTPALPPAASISKVGFVKEIPAQKVLNVAVDQQGRMYLVKKDGTVGILSKQGLEISTLPERDRTGEKILKKPTALAIYNDKIYITDRGCDHVAVFTTAGAFLEKIGEGGSGPKEFRNPAGIAVFKGVIYVSDPGNKRIQVIGPNGVYLHDINGRPGPGMQTSPEQQLYEPAGLAVDQRGRIYVIDNGDHSVKIYSQAGEFIDRLPDEHNPVALAMAGDGFYVADLESYGIRKYDFDNHLLFSFGTKGQGRGQFAALTGLGLDEKGDIYVPDYKRGLIQVFLPEQNKAPYPAPTPPPTSASWITDLKTPAHIGKTAWDGKDTLYAVDGRNIYKIKPDSNIPLSIVKCSPIAIAVDADGYLWVLDGRGDRVLKMDSEARILLSFGSSGKGPGRFSDPTDLAISKDGVIFVADPGNGFIHVFNRDGVFLSVISAGPDGSTLRKPFALSLNNKGVLYVLDSDYSILTFAPDGTAIGRFGKAGDFDKPVDLMAADHEIFILDAGSDNIKVFTPRGAFVRSFGAAGRGNGDFRSPTAITFRDNISFYVSDPKNKRIQELAINYTPSAPAGIRAEKKMRAVNLSWQAVPETYVNAYHIYRSEKKSGPFTLLSTTKNANYRDQNVEPGKVYFYQVSALAMKGNESLPSAMVSSVPESYLPSCPENPAAEAQEWSVKLSWAPDNSPFISHYLIYRQDDGEFRQIGKTKEVYFVDSSLTADTKYNYRITAVSTDNHESQPAAITAKTKTARKAPIEIEALELNNIFSNTYKIYEKSGMGRITITNNTGQAIPKIKVSFLVKEFMDFPSEMTIDNLEPGQCRELTLRAIFNNKILNVTEDTPVQTEIGASYYENSVRREYFKTSPVNIYEKHRLMWDVPERFATFISPKDPVLLEFVRSAVTRHKETDDTILRAAAIFDAFGDLGVTYIPDPGNPYQVTSGTTDFVDYVQYPRETLQRKSGDCDDLVALYTAALESIGIKTMVVTIPGHMLMMFSTGLEASGQSDTQDELYVVHDGLIWVPVETTMTGASFISAWGRGSKTYYQWLQKNLTLLDLRAAWQTFKPATLPDSSWRPATRNKTKSPDLFLKESRQLKKIVLRLSCRNFYTRLQSKPGDIQALMGIGIIYGKAGEAKEARQAFQKILTMAPKNVGALNNLGNLYFLGEKYQAAQKDYEKAAALEPDDARIMVNLARCYLRQKMRKKAARVFNKARKLSPDITKTYRTLALELSNAP